MRTSYPAIVPCVTAADLRDRLGRWVVASGVTAAVALYLSLALPRVLATHEFVPDESAHVAYAFEVSAGHLPELGRHVVARTLPGQPVSYQYVANHPPLYHVLAGWVLRAATPDSALLTGRLFTALLTVPTIVLAALLALSLRVRFGRQLAVATAALVASFAPLILAGASVQNDSLLALCGTAALTALVRVIRIGPTRARYAGLSVACAAGMLTKINMIATVAVAVAALAATAAATPRGRRRVRAWLSGPALVLAVTAAAAGWFYARIWSRYGDPLGGSVIYSLVAHRDREPSGTTVQSYLLDPRSWWNLWAQAFGGDYTRRSADPSITAPLAAAGAILVLAGAAIWAAGGIRRRRDWPRGRDAVQALAIPAALVAVVLGPVVLIADHVTHLGAPQARYLVPAVAAYAVIIASTLARLPGRRLGLAAIAFVGLQVVGTVAGIADALYRASGKGTTPDLDGHGWWHAFEVSLAARGHPPQLVAVFVATGAVALVVIAVSLAVTGRSESTSSPDSAARVTTAADEPVGVGGLAGRHLGSLTTPGAEAPF